MQLAADAQNVLPEAGASVKVGGKLDDLGTALLGRIRVIAGHVSKAFGPWNFVAISAAWVKFSATA